MGIDNEADSSLSRHASKCNHANQQMLQSLPACLVFIYCNLHDMVTSD
jgi:hypothetical protein